MDDDHEDEYDDEDGGYRMIEIREQDRFLPIANIARIMKRVLPGNAKIAKDAKESIQECVSEFISFITSEASEKCQQEKRKTINGDDILWAMSTLGFDKYVEPLKAYLFKYRDSVKGEKPEKKSSSSKKSSSESLAQPKKSMYDVPDTMSMHYSRPMSTGYAPQHNPPHHQGSMGNMGGMAMSYNSYGAATSAPPSGMSFMVDHSAPMVAPSKGEPGHVSLPPPPPMTLQPPLSLPSMTSSPGLSGMSPSTNSLPYMNSMNSMNSSPSFTLPPTAVGMQHNGQSMMTAPNHQPANTVVKTEAPNQMAPMYSEQYTNPGQKFDGHQSNFP